MQAAHNMLDLNRSIRRCRHIFKRKGLILPFGWIKTAHRTMRREKPNTWRGRRAARALPRAAHAAFEPTLHAPARQSACGFGAMCVVSSAYC